MSTLLNLKRHRKGWSRGEIKFLCDTHAKRDEIGPQYIERVARKLGRTESAVEMKLSRLGLTFRNDAWKPGEVRKALDMKRAHIPITVIAKRLGTGRSYTAVQLKLLRIRKRVNRLSFPTRYAL